MVVMIMEDIHYDDIDRLLKMKVGQPPIGIPRNKPSSFCSHFLILKFEQDKLRESCPGT